MNEIIDAISARVKAPYFGYALLAFVAMNWRGIFLLGTIKGPPSVRLAAFDGETSVMTLFVLPWVVGGIVAATAPWIKYGFAFVSSKPFESIDNLHLDAEHKKTIRKTELERSRADLFASKEAELIERAKRDEEVMSIDDAKLKERLQSEIVALRRERDRMSASPNEASNVEPMTPVERSLLAKAADFGDGVITKNDYLQGRSFQIGFETLGGENRREFVRYESALKSLVHKGLLNDLGRDGMRFELTSEGWDFAEALIGKP